MSEPEDMWNSELSMLGKKNERALFAGGCGAAAPAVAREDERNSSKGWRSRFGEAMIVRVMKLHYSEASLSMLMESFSA
ncbi:hypothetical protein CDL12_10577 [Handroanthus impetiginosus]|uniref:Uncharacterized protein n=1 Tax=Handroanthus impetiginosus TaxID=429701 RepID=A0A2G9HGZ4_9LAMI|nr:hypothetical protein CDL12_10577 [Handroanthus impetiginosus]